MCAEGLNERALRMRVTDAPRHDRDLEVAGVDIGQLLAADRAPRHDLDAEGVERLLRVVRCARPVCEVAWRVHLELELLPILGVDAVGALRIAGRRHQPGGLCDVVGVGIQLAEIRRGEPLRDQVVREARHVLLRLRGISVGHLRALVLIDGHRDGLTEALVLEGRGLLPVEVDRRAGVTGSANDADARIDERLVRREWESVCRVVDVARQDERGHLRGLALVDDDLVEVDTVPEKTVGVAGHRELRLGD